MFFTPYENSKVVIFDMLLQDLALLCIYQYQYQYLFPQETSFYCGFINDFGPINIEFGLRKGLKVILT